VTIDEQSQFEQLLISSIETQSFIKLTLGKYKGQEAGLCNLVMRIVSLKSGVKLSLISVYRTKEVVKNYPIEEGLEIVKSMLGQTFMSGRLFTIEQDVQLEFNKKKIPRFTITKPTVTNSQATMPQAHDHQKNRPIKAENNLYLTSLGVVNDQGRIVKSMEGKFRQINKFIEIINSLLISSKLLEKNHVSVLDMGAGKGYLTFALYDLLSHQLAKDTSIVGIESRSHLVDFCNGVARDVGFDGLSFEQGHIGDCRAESVDVTIALHACDTATDDAIHKGIMSRSSLIVLAPCCHQQIRKQMQPSAVIKDLLSFGILMERQSEIVTDGLRASLLELSGYDTNVFEFISPEHTSKNVMIAAVKHDRPVDRDRILNQINGLKQLYGIKLHYLEALLFPQDSLSDNLARLVNDRQP
jgi:hypothetical protein